MSRPGAWGRVLSNLWGYLRKDWAVKQYIGEDAAGHRYYELRNTKRNVKRGFDPPANAPHSEPSVEWQSWLKGTRRFPPSEEEIALNRLKQQVADDGASMDNSTANQDNLCMNVSNRGLWNSAPSALTGVLTGAFVNPAQLEQDASTEKRAPVVAATGSNEPRNKPAAFPRYKDLETGPGSKPSD